MPSPNPLPSADGLPKTAAAAAPSDPAALDEVLRLHSQLAAGARGLAPSPETRLAPDAFQAADQDGDGLLSREEFVVGYHKQILDSGRSPAADLAAEATRLAALSRARRALTSRGAAAGEPRPALEGVGRGAGRGAGQDERPPTLSVRTLIPGTPVAAPTRVDERGNGSGAPPAAAGIDRPAGERAAPPARPSDAHPVRPPESSADRRSVSPIPWPPLTKPGRSPAGERPVSVAPPAPGPRPPRP